MIGEFPSGAACWDIDELTAAASTAPDVAPDVALDSHSPAALVYTSGTTGASKGAVLTQENFAGERPRSVAKRMEITSDDRYLAVLPLFHVHGLGNGIQTWLAVGCHMKFVERFDHATAAEPLRVVRADAFFGVPTMYVRYARYRRRPRPSHSDSTRACSSPDPRRSPRTCMRRSARNMDT